MEWSDNGRTLTTEEMRRLFRDACAKLGKCAANSAPATLVSKSPEELAFDEPPLRARPNHEKRALSYMIAHLLHQANIYVRPSDFPVDYFADNPEEPLQTGVDHVAEFQFYPER